VTGCLFLASFLSPVRDTRQFLDTGHAHGVHRPGTHSHTPHRRRRRRRPSRARGGRARPGARPPVPGAPRGTTALDRTHMRTHTPLLSNVNRQHSTVNTTHTHVLLTSTIRFRILYSVVCILCSAPSRYTNLAWGGHPRTFVRGNRVSCFALFYNKLPRGSTIRHRVECDRDAHVHTRGAPSRRRHLEILSPLSLAVSRSRHGPWTGSTD